MSTRITCGACAGAQLATFLDLGKTPLANKFPTEAQIGIEDWYPLALGRCGNCGLVQNMEVIPDEEIYGQDYGFYSGGSQAQREYHRTGATLLAERHLTPNAGTDRLVVEVACNDGSLLQYFHRWGYRSIGIDPAAPAKVAQEAGLGVIQALFTAQLAREIRDSNGPADLIIAYNSMAHVGDLSDVLTGIWALLASDGVAVVEVQYLPDLIAGNMYDQVYHEHRYFYSATSFKHAAELHGLYVIDVELIELQGGGVRFTLSSDPQRAASRSVAATLHSERWLDDASAFEGVQGRVDRIRDHLLDLIAAENNAGRSVAGYAAAAKATTILNYCGLGADRIPFVIDTTPYKQGRYVPGTGIPIVAEGQADTLLLLAPNYLSHMLRAHPDQRWLLPLPTPCIV